MPLVRRLGGLVHKVVADLSRGRLEPGSGLPFELVLRAQATLAKVDFIRRGVFREELELLDRFLAHRGIVNPRDVEIARRERTLASLIRRMRMYYATLSSARQRVWLPLAAEVQPILKGGAFLVGTHFGGGFLTPLALSQLQIPILAIVRSRPTATLRPRLVDIRDLSRESPRRAIADAWATLRRGGVVFMAADRSSGTTNDIEVTVLGRKRLIAQGFAALSVASSIPPTPVFSRVEETGKILTWIEPPLAISGASYQARVASVARSYARQVSTVFGRHPGNVTPGSIRRYFESPQCHHDEGGEKPV